MDTNLIPLPPLPTTPEVTRINEVCWIRDVEDSRTVSVHGVPLFHYDRGDRVSERQAAVTLINDGVAQQQEVAAALGVGVSTVRCWQRRFESGGVAALARKKRQAPLLKMGGARDRIVRRMFGEGRTNVEIARRIGVCEYTVRYTLKRLGLKRQRKSDAQGVLLLEPTPTDVGEVGAEVDGGEAGPAAPVPGSGEAVDAKAAVEAPQPADEGPGVAEADQTAGEPVAAASVSETEKVIVPSVDRSPEDRSGDRLLACLGLLEDASPLFGRARNVPGGGVLLSVPFILQSGVLEVFQRRYGSLGAAFYGLRTTVLSLLLMALLRIRRPENLKERSATDLGRLLGLDRFPEVKTLRRKLTALADRRLGRDVMREMARRRIREDRTRIGFLYVDGHVREYHGKGKLAKAYVTRRRLAAKGATDTWVNDRNGEPLFVITADLNEQVGRMLEPILDEIEAVLGEKQRLTLVFDRGGWDLKLFARLIKRGYDILTYRKGRCADLPPALFSERKAVIDGGARTYVLHDMCVALGRGDSPLWMRQVTRLKDGRQTQVLTTRQDLDAVEVLWRMFNRWRQENFFKYMRREYALDALVDYALEPVDDRLDRPNPERSALDNQLRKARSELRKLTAQLGDAATGDDVFSWTTLAGFRHSHGAVVEEIERKRRRIEDLVRLRDACPRRVPASDLQRLARERKLITDTLKMTAYQIESRLLECVRGHFARSEDEGRRLIVSALQSPADIEARAGELRVTLAAQSAPHRTRAVAALCRQLNSLGVRFPGTDLRMHFRIRPN